MRVRARTIPPFSATAPPLSPVPAPLATTGMPCLAATLTTRDTCSVLAGNTTASGRALSTEPSYSKTIRSSGACTTYMSPTIRLSSSMIWPRSTTAHLAERGYIVADCHYPFKPRLALAGAVSKVAPGGPNRSW